jgi:hypothetical protein
MAEKRNSAQNPVAGLLFFGGKGDHENEMSIRSKKQKGTRKTKAKSRRMSAHRRLVQWEVVVR